MIRSLHTRPAGVDFNRLATELSAELSDFTGCNDVDGQVAVYTTTPHNTDQVAAIVAAHSGPPAFPPLDSNGVTICLLVVEALLPAEVGASTLGVPVAHLIHEATAWAL
jgi:hypothetical protein